MSTRIILGALLVAAMLTTIANRAGAEETILADCTDTCSNGVVAEVELMFLRPSRGDGFSRNNIFDYETSPRVRFAYETDRGAGIRLQYWEFDHTVDNGHNGNLSSIDASNLDLDFYKRIGLGADSKLEFGGGFRYSEYRDQNVADSGQRTSFDGYGGFLGVQAWQNLGCDVNAFARGKWALLHDNGNDNGNIEYDVTRTHQEIAVGIERAFSFSHCVTTLRAGGEWQNWDGYQDNTDGSIGFTGFLFGLGVKL